MARHWIWPRAKHRLGLERPHFRALEQLQASFGTKVVREVSDPAVIAVFRLAIAEAVQAPEVARALNSIGREASRAVLRKIMAEAQASGLLAGRPVELAQQFAGLLWGDLMVSLLLGVAERPNRREIARRARDAAASFLQLHPLPMEKTAEYSTERPAQFQVRSKICKWKVRCDSSQFVNGRLNGALSRNGVRGDERRLPLTGLLARNDSAAPYPFLSCASR
jgi:hypothetical protein